MTTNEVPSLGKLKGALPKGADNGLREELTAALMEDHHGKHIIVAQVFLAEMNVIYSRNPDGVETAYASPTLKIDRIEWMGRNCPVSVLLAFLEANRTRRRRYEQPLPIEEHLSVDEHGSFELKFSEGEAETGAVEPDGAGPVDEQDNLTPLPSVSEAAWAEIERQILEAAGTPGDVDDEAEGDVPDGEPEPDGEDIDETPEQDGGEEE